MTRIVGSPDVPTSELPIAPDFTGFIPPRTDRCLIVGQTGSGKTTLARALLAYRQYVVVIDAKATLDWPGYLVCRSLAALTKAKGDRLTYRPSYAEWRDEPTQEKLWEWCYRRGHCTVYVDETAAVTDGDQFPHYYGACLMRGREHGVELWSATQRPMRIPQVTMSESEQVFAFRLRLPQDRARVQSVTGIDAERIAALAKRQFLYAPQDGAVQGPFTLSLDNAAGF